VKKIEPIDPPDDAAPDPVARADAHLIARLAPDDPLRLRFEALQADNARYRADEAERKAPVWLTLKRAADRAACHEEWARSWAARAIAAGRANEARKDGRVLVNVTAMIADRRAKGYCQ
jgi:hypothetical protein